MGRVSLTESYDDRSVISKLNEMDKRVTENTTVVTAAEASAQASAAAAQETADRFAGSVGAVVQNANAQINASKAQVDQAKAEVDATVTTVAQAVQTANNASTSAQQSAQTVATYDARLTAVEDADTQNVKLTGAQIITGEKTFSNIYIPTTNGNYNGGAVIKVPNNLSTTDIITSKNDNSASILNLRLIKDDKSTSLMTMIRTPSNQQKYTVFQVNDDGTNVLRGPSPYSGAPSDSYTTKGYVESTDGVTNNLVHRTANEKVDGIKTFVQRVDFDSSTVDLNNPPSYASRGMSQVNTGPNLDTVAMREEMLYSSGGNTLQFIVHAHGEDEAHTDHTATLMMTVFRDGTARLRLVRESGTVEIVPRG